MEGRDAGASEDRVSEPVPAHHHHTWTESVPWIWRHAKKVVVGVIGGTVVLIGLALLVLPGPGTLVVILGLAILATEFAFAAKWLRYAKKRAQAIAEYAHLRRHPPQEENKPGGQTPPEANG